MIGIVSICIGIVLAFMSLLLIRREIVRASNNQKRSFSSLSDENVSKVMKYLKKIETELDDLNASYYEIVSDLEGKYSVHEKEIELLQESLDHVRASQSRIRNTKDIQPVSVQEPVAMNEKERVCNEATRLKHAGLPLSQIAKELNMGIGELQLILKTQK